MIVKFNCEYIGKDFHGFQKQGQKRTIQLVLEEALSKFFGTQIKVHASGRTDSGVHSKGQVCSFLVDEASFRKDVDLFKLNMAVNAMLPSDVSVKGFQIAEEGFHAQFSAKTKTYLYRVYLSRFRSAIKDGFYYQVFKVVDTDLVKKAAEKLVGQKCFESFTSEPTDSKNFVREIFSFDVEQRDDELWFWVKGSGFMRNMVRIMVGTVLDVAQGNMSFEDFEKAINGFDRKLAGETAPARGLTLWSVDY